MNRASHIISRYERKTGRGTDRRIELIAGEPRKEQDMEKLELFRNLPEGFRKVEDDIDRKLAALTLTQAFADSRYPIPSNSISYSEYMKLYYELAGILSKKDFLLLRIRKHMII